MKHSVSEASVLNLQNIDNAQVIQLFEVLNSESTIAIPTCVGCAMWHVDKAAKQKCKIVRTPLLLPKRVQSIASFSHHGCSPSPCQAASLLSRVLDTKKTTFGCNHFISAPHESREVDDFLEDLDEQPVSAQQKEVRCSEFLD